MDAQLLRKKGYTYIRQIGKGAFGCAVHVKKNGQDYVCKTIKLTSATEKEKRAAMKEAELLTMFKHPYVVKHVEHFLESGWLMIVQEYCEGGDLQDRISKARKTRPLSDADVMKWFTQALLGLKYLHQRRILHRDIKGSNFFLKNEDLKIGDFGIAKVLSGTCGLAKTMIGTPYYLSPEICKGESYSWPSDMWALGCFLYELISLKPPFEARVIKDLMRKITSGTMPRWPKHPLSAIGSELLQRDVNKRPRPRQLVTRPEFQDEIRRLKRIVDEQKMFDFDVNSEIDTPAGDIEQNVENAGGCLPKKGVALYKIGDILEYWSQTHHEWLVTTVTAVNEEGAIQVHIKPKAWLSLQFQCEKVRRHTPPTPSRAKVDKVPEPPGARKIEPSPRGAVANNGNPNFRDIPSLAPRPPIKAGGVPPAKPPIGKRPDAKLPNVPVIPMRNVGNRNPSPNREQSQRNRVDSPWRQPSSSPRWRSPGWRNPSASPAPDMRRQRLHGDLAFRYPSPFGGFSPAPQRYRDGSPRIVNGAPVPNSRAPSPSAGRPSPRRCYY
eukprot:GEMP01006380.1.p1 GENE.GEMP01006380.1~~GEMP01006380.1.p1  ORF type:complete len:551 (+),score=130.54 GEMP01006380.1:505-2157(+)